MRRTFVRLIQGPVRYSCIKNQNSLSLSSACFRRASCSETELTMSGPVTITGNEARYAGMLGAPAVVEIDRSSDKFSAW